ncbi:uncharacterized protein C11orf97 homolog [Eubalaena glacialis]|uniref:uncharacterized protein C11orf97 homolog n=1 Tax=Eubalaena glacialis TaxID=27606 RepID=UPI002A5A895C|nr:uncharacterized protein C11orf97 homolog [Eubalaena glacialis]
MRGEEAVTAVAMPEAGRDGEQSRPPAGLGCGARGETGGRGPQESRKQWKKFLYCEPHKRIKEVLEEELYIKRDESHIKHPPAVALEGIWSIRRNLPVGGLKPGLLSRNSLLPQAKYYSRHGGLQTSICQRYLWQDVEKAGVLAWKHKQCPDSVRTYDWVYKS